MKSLKRYLLVGLAAMLAVSCTETNNDSSVNNNDTIPKTDTDTVVKPPVVIEKDSLSPLFHLTEPDKKLLLLVENVKPGFSFDEIKKVYPELKGIRPESSKDYLAEEGFTESLSSLQLLSGDAKWEINFKDDSVYYHFFSCQKKEEDAANAYDALLVFYTNRHGASRRDPTEEENNYSQTAIWILKDNSTLFLKYDLNTGQIFWGRRLDRAL